MPPRHGGSSARLVTSDVDLEASTSSVSPDARKAGATRGKCFAAIAGVFLVGYVGQVDQWTGRGYELDSIVAAVMGGVAITGGRGHIFGALLGVLILIVMFNAVILLGLPVQIQLILKGVIVIAASALYLSDGGERT
jgi:ABC-type xylose transport system permease subunit